MEYPGASRAPALVVARIERMRTNGAGLRSLGKSCRGLERRGSTLLVIDTWPQGAGAKPGSLGYLPGMLPAHHSVAASDRGVTNAVSMEKALRPSRSAGLKVWWNVQD